MAQELSGYQIYWAEFRAVRGNVTAHDRMIISRYPVLSKMMNVKAKTYLEHFPSKESALAYIESKKERFALLDKKYEVRLCTDKQFGMRERYDEPIRFTEKQESEMFTIG